MATLFVATPVLSQENNNEEEIRARENDVREMISFLEYMLNTVGSSTTSARDKEVIITQSFRKIFRDEEVQIEDDLDENRDVITNKNVSAYLKDVDFFFENVQFKFDVNNITHKRNTDGILYFKADLIRTLKGLNHEKDSIKNSKQRFIELNYNAETKDLKIVSIYTNEFDRSKFLKDWWEHLSYGWKSIFKDKLEVSVDEPGYSLLKRIVGTKSLDLSGNELLQDIGPLSEFKQLEYLDVSHTMITDISPLRNLSNLKTLRLNNTLVTHIDALKYNSGIQVLTINDTAIDDIEILERLKSLNELNLSGTFVKSIRSLEDNTGLKNLDISNTTIYDLSPLANKSNLEVIKASQTKVQNLSPLSGCSNLEEVYLESTPIISIQPLQSLTNLKLININGTSINSLDALKGLKKVVKIYCDNTLVSKEQAEKYMLENSKTLVVYESKSLKVWWEEVEEDWKIILNKLIDLGADPSAEDLARVAQIDSINISSSKTITSLANLIRMPQLRYLNAHGTSIEDINELKYLNQLEHVILSDTRISNLNALAGLKNIKILEVDNTEVDDLNALYGHSNLEIVYADSTKIWDTDVIDLLAIHPQATVIYKSGDLVTWWNEMPDIWKQIFFDNMALPDKPTKLELHQLSQIKKIEFERKNVNSLNYLSQMIQLRRLKFNETAIADISPLNRQFYLEELDMSQNPIENLTPISELREIRSLNIANSLVDDLRDISQLSKLETLNCSGTQIKRLDGLENLSYLESLDCSNTRVKHLDPVIYSNLTLLKCFNTRVRDSSLEEFISVNPDCNVIFY